MPLPFWRYHIKNIANLLYDKAAKNSLSHIVSKYSYKQQIKKLFSCVTTCSSFNLSVCTINIMVFAIHKSFEITLSKIMRKYFLTYTLEASIIAACFQLLIIKMLKFLLILSTE